MSPPKGEGKGGARPSGTRLRAKGGLGRRVVVVVVAAAVVGVVAVAVAVAVAAVAVAVAIVVAAFAGDGVFDLQEKRQLLKYMNSCLRVIKIQDIILFEIFIN